MWPSDKPVTFPGCSPTFTQDRTDSSKNVINKILAATLAHVNLPYFPVYLCNVLCWNFISAFLKHVSHLFEWEPSNPAPARVRRRCGIHPPVSQGKGVRERWGDKYKNSTQTSCRTLGQKSFKSGWKQHEFNFPVQMAGITAKCSTVKTTTRGFKTLKRQRCRCRALPFKDPQYDSVRCERFHDSRLSTWRSAI